MFIEWTSSYQVCVLNANLKFKMAATTRSGPYQKYDLKFFHL